MEKKAQVTSAIFKKSFNGQYGESHVYAIAFDNGDKGEYISKKNPQSTFVEGQEASYTIETKQNGQYTNTYIKPVQVAGAAFPGKGNPAYEHKRTALKCATDLVCSGKVTEKQLLPTAEKLLEFLNK